MGQCELDLKRQVEEVVSLIDRVCCGPSPSPPWPSSAACRRRLKAASRACSPSHHPRPPPSDPARAPRTASPTNGAPKRAHRAMALPATCRSASAARRPRRSSPSRQRTGPSATGLLAQRRRRHQNPMRTPVQKLASSRKPRPPHRFHSRRRSRFGCRAIRGYQRRMSAILMWSPASTPRRMKWCPASDGRSAILKHRPRPAPEVFASAKLASNRRNRRAEAGRSIRQPRVTKRRGSPPTDRSRTAALVKSTFSGATRAPTSTRMTGPSPCRSRSAWTRWGRERWSAGRLDADTPAACAAPRRARWSTRRCWDST